MFLTFFAFCVIFSGLTVYLFKITIFSSLCVLALSFTCSIIAKRIHKSSLKTCPVVPRSIGDTTGVRGGRVSYDSFMQFPLTVRGKSKNNLLNIHSLCIILIWIFTVGIISILIHHQSFGYLASPWQILPGWVFLSFFCLFLGAMLLLFFAQDRLTVIQKYLMLVPVFFLSFSILAFVFPLGSDYDPYVHRAAETALVHRGVIEPRTILYSGEYGIVSMLSILTHLPVKTINIWLLPILAALTLPWLLFKTFSPLTPLAFLLLPFSFLTITVPQGLGMWFLLLLILTHWGNTHRQKHIFNFPSIVHLWRTLADRQFSIFNYGILALAAFLSHPFPGIAACIFIGGIVASRLFQKMRFGYLSFVICHLSFSSLLLPLALYLNNFRASEFRFESFAFHPERVEVLKSLFHFGWVRFVDPLSFIELFSRNYFLFFFALAGIGIWILKLRSNREKNGYPLSFLLPFLSLLLSALFLLFFFQFNLTDLETKQIFERIFSISILFLFPFFLKTIECVECVLKKLKEIKVNNCCYSNSCSLLVYCPAFCLFIIVLISSLYQNYPRVDRYENFKGFNISSDDLKTVQYIEQKTKAPYLVLANQQMGAAALDQFGFLRYVHTADERGNETRMNAEKNGRPFFYSIPVSSRAQAFFLEAVNTPSPQTIQKVFEEYEINELYVIVSPYWKKADWIARELKKIADENFTVGENRIFKFNLPSLKI